MAPSGVSQLTSLTQQVTPIIVLFYDAPAPPVGVFDDFLAIQAAQGNVSTLSYFDIVVGTDSLVTPTTRSVIRNSVGGKETDTIPDL